MLSLVMGASAPVIAEEAVASTGVADPGFLAQYAATYRFRLGRPTSMTPTPQGDAVLFLRSGPRSFVRDLWQLDVDSGEERVLLTAGSILKGQEERLSVEEQARRERQRLVARGIARYTLSRDGRRILVPLAGRLFVVERADGSVRELKSDAGNPIDPQFSPDAERVACVRDGELHVVDVASGQERRVTSGAGGAIANALAEFVAQEEMSRHHGYWWSPDSKRLVYQQTDTTGLEVMNIADATHPEREADRWPYPRPGKRNARVKLGIVSAAGGPTTWISWDRERYEYLASVRWSENAPLTILVQNRRQTEQRLLAVDPRTGATETLLVEKDDAWLDLDQKMPLWLPDGSAFLWTTERNGAWQLELRERDGRLRHAVTPLDLGFKQLARLLPERDEALVLASPDPTETHAWRVPLDPEERKPTRLLDEPGSHELKSNRAGTLMVHTHTPVQGPTRYEALAFRSETGAPRPLAIRSLAESPSFEPRIELTTVGKDPKFHAVLIRPRDFEPGRKYPVIVHVYGGPTSQMVRATGQRYLLDQWIADHGYIVVAIDGRGTPGRGSAWQRIVKNDLIKVPLEDQAKALRLLGKKYPELDLERVGIYGWSFGGYFSAMAVMREPGLFKAGVAGAPVVDWRDYDTHYTERYMDTPQNNPDGYDAANVMTYADRLSRPLLLIHGTADDNVYFTHSLKLADALFRAGKDFDFLPLPGFTHMVPDPLVTERLYGRILRHFDRHLRRGPTAD
jgi:dipeptidyl-peptidase-4